MSDLVRTDDDVYRLLAREVSDVTGVVLGEKKHSLVQSRLIKRIRDLGFQTALLYWPYFKAHREEEMPAIISLLTTHHTFFFREWAHFEFLAQELPGLVQKLRTEGRKKVKIWSAACSFGHEVYSLAMFLENKLKAIAPDFDFEILGTDVDEKSVKIASNGVYKWDEVQKMPAVYLAGHWARGTGEIQSYAKVKSALKSKCRFQPANLTRVSKELRAEKFDFIFCRNVFIYFTREQIKLVVDELSKFLNPGAHLILGLSESLYDLDVPVSHIGKSIYTNAKAAEKAPSQFKAAQSASPVKPIAGTASSPSAPMVQTAPLSPIRVVCVDDSPSVLKILSKVFERNPNFKVVGTAKNGIEAAALLKTVKADLMTLDIHMPEQDGIEYLRTNYKKGHPAVIIISSVARGDAKFAMKALEYGASDYIEKPSLDTLTQVGDEILLKAEVAARSNVPVNFANIEVEKSFMRELVIQNASQKALVLFFNIADKQKISYILGSLVKPHPPVYLVAQAMDTLKDDLAPSLAKEFKVDLQTWAPGQVMSENRFYFLHPSELDKVTPQFSKKPVALGILGPLSPKIEEHARKIATSALLTEDIGTQKASTLRPTGHVPYTSFAYDLCRGLMVERKAA